MSYYHAKKTAEAKRYLEDRELMMREKKHRDMRAEASREWLDEYRSHPRPTRFDWRPSMPVIKPVVTPITPPGDYNGKEIIEGEFTELADADASSEGRGQSGQAEGGGGAARPSIAGPKRKQEDYETPF